MEEGGRLEGSYLTLGTDDASERQSWPFEEEGVR